MATSNSTPIYTSLTDATRRKALSHRHHRSLQLLITSGASNGLASRAQDASLDRVDPQIGGLLADNANITDCSRRCRPAQARAPSLTATSAVQVTPMGKSRSDLLPATSA